MKEFSVPTGMRDLILEECVVKKQLQTQIEAVLNNWGYEEIITPTIEYYKTYEEGFEDINEKDMYKFFDANGRILMLRADMTIPIARVAATKFKESKTPLRFRYCANVFKVHEELSGLQSEISDCGVELIGMEESCAQLEILATAMDALQVVQGKKCILEIGNILFFQEACNSIGLQKEEITTLAKWIDKKSLKSLEEYVQELQLESKYQEFFLRLPWLSGNVEVLEEAKQYAFNDRLLAIIEELQELATNLKTIGYEAVQFDLGKVTNLNYYTGIIFEAFVEGVGARVLSGGSYNTLLAKFGKDVPAIGFSIKLDALLDVTPIPTSKSKKVICYPEDKKIEAILESKKQRKDCVVKLEVDNSLNEVITKEVA